MGIRVSETGKFDLLLDEIKTALPITDGLVREVVGVSCISAAAATHGLALLLASPKEIN